MSLLTGQGRARKTACEMCRARKRRCDGRLPTCSLCHKARFHCTYATQVPHTPDPGVMFNSVLNPAQTGISTPVNYNLSQYLAGNLDPIQDTTPGHTVGSMQQFSPQLSMPMPEFDLDASAFEQTSVATINATDHSQQDLPISPTTQILASGPNPSQLPSPELVLDMVNSFFSAQHQLLPSVHRKSFMAKVSNDMTSLSSGPFLWVILALYCHCNKSDSMQEQYHSWMQMAHSKLELMSANLMRSNITNMLQASIWMVFDSYCRGDITKAWLLLGRTAQLTSAFGLDRIDSKRQTPMIESELKSCSDIELEECRKCMWCLALLDRVIVSVNGLALSVDDRNFHVNFPLPDEEFQEAQNSIEYIEYLRESYSPEAFDLLNGNVTSTMVTKPSFKHILKVSVILGRALAIQNSIPQDDGSTHKQHLEKLRILESVLNIFCYASSASGEGIGPTSLMQLWLKMLTQCSKILILHPPRPSTLGLCDCLSSLSPAVSATRTDTECVRAAMNAAHTFSHALKETLLALNNPFLLPMACTSVRMLTLLRNQTHESDRERIRELLGEILQVVDHIAIKFPGAAAKARETIMRRVNEFENGTKTNSLRCYVGLDCE